VISCCQSGEAQEQRSAPDGRAVFVARCGKCHGQNGEGGVGARLVPGDRLGGYGTAQGLYDYVSRIMPFDAPGTLPTDEYWAVVTYLATTNGFADEGTVLGPDNASGVRLTK